MEKEVKIIFEDSDLMVLEKPAGLVTTKEKKNERNYSLEDWLQKNRKNSLERNGIVHRLDKGTSGLVLVAKNKDSLINLKRQFKERTIQKKYIAMVCGDASYQGEINMPIGRSKYSFGKFSVGIDGKKSLTIFKLLEKFKNNGKIYSLLEIDLKTGRTHQIRVHFSYLKWPLLGDKLYGGETEDLDRPFLHAFQIRFKHPISGNEMMFKSELPEDLKNILNNYEKV